MIPMFGSRKYSYPHHGGNWKFQRGRRGGGEGGQRPRKFQGEGGLGDQFSFQRSSDSIQIRLSIVAVQKAFLTYSVEFSDENIVA